MHTPHLIYLHGFRSSPGSPKARLTSAAVAERFPRIKWLCPTLLAAPKQAMQSRRPTAQLFKVKADVANRLRLLERPLGTPALN